MASSEGAKNAPVLDNFVQRYKAAQRIAVRRRKTKPDSWAKIAEAEGLSVRAVRYLDQTYMDASDEAPESKAVVDEHVYLFTEVMDRMATILDNERTQDANRIGAARLLIDTAVRRIELLQAAGRVPRRLYLAEQYATMRSMVEELAQVLKRHELPEEAIAELREVVARHDPQRKQLEAAA